MGTFAHSRTPPLAQSVLCGLRKLTALSGLTASENGDLGHVVVGGALMYRKQRLLVVIHHL